MDVTRADVRGVGVVFGIVVRFAEVRALVWQFNERAVGGLGSKERS
jgi:hypothetical protein